jgi:hypothetical protein
MAARAMAFAYMLRLRQDGNEQDILALLAEERRAEVQAALQALSDIPPDQLSARLQKLQEMQMRDSREKAKSRYGLGEGGVSSKLYAWLTRPF